MLNENLNLNFRDLDDIAEEFILEKIVNSRNPETSQVGELFLQDLVILFVYKNVKLYATLVNLFVNENVTVCRFVITILFHFGNSFLPVKNVTYILSN